MTDRSSGTIDAEERQDGAPGMPWAAGAVPLRRAGEERSEDADELVALLVEGGMPASGRRRRILAAGLVALAALVVGALFATAGPSSNEGSAPVKAAAAPKSESPEIAPGRIAKEAARAVWREGNLKKLAARRRREIVQQRARLKRRRQVARGARSAESRRGHDRTAPGAPAVKAGPVEASSSDTSAPQVEEAPPSEEAPSAEETAPVQEGPAADAAPPAEPPPSERAPPAEEVSLTEEFRGGLER